MTNLAHLPAAHPGKGNQIVSANIRAEIGYADISQGSLAEALSLSEMAISRRLSNKYAAEFSASEIMAAADFFGIHPGELFKTRTRPAPTVPPKLQSSDYIATVSDLNKHRLGRANSANKLFPTDSKKRAV